MLKPMKLGFSFSLSIVAMPSWMMYSKSALTAALTSFGYLFSSFTCMLAGRPRILTCIFAMFVREKTPHHDHQVPHLGNSRSCVLK